MELFVRAAPAIFFWLGVGWYCTERKTVESTGSAGECRVRPVELQRVGWMRIGAKLTLKQQHQYGILKHSTIKYNTVELS